MGISASTVIAAECSAVSFVQHACNTSCFVIVLAYEGRNQGRNDAAAAGDIWKQNPHVVQY